MKKLLVLACMLVACSISQGAEIAKYTFSTGDASAFSSDANVTAGSFLPVGPGLTGYGGRSGSGNMYVRSSGTDGSVISIGSAIAGEDYLTVTIGPDAGYEMDLSSLTFDFGYTNTTGFIKQLKAYLLTSIDGFVDVDDIVGSKTIDMDTVTQTPSYTAVTIDLSAAQFQDIITATEFRIYLSDDTNTNDIIHRIDNVVLNGAVEVPFQDPNVVTRTPDTGSTNLPVSQTLDWTLLGGGTVEDYVDVYFGTTPDPCFVEASNSAGTYAPALVNDTTYYWTLVTYDPNEFGTPTANPAQPTWWFTTAAANAEITGDPVGQTVVAGTEVTLGVTANNATEYRWYKNGVEIPGSNSDSLVLSVQLADEGEYHCEAYNAANPYPNAHFDAISHGARVMTKRLAGWWKLDGDLLDSVAEVVPGATPHDGTAVEPSYVAGVVGVNALAFADGEPDEIVSIAGDGYLNFFPQGYTVSCWMKTPNNTAWASFLAKIDGNTGFRSAISGGGGGNDYSHAHALHTSTNISFIISKINITDDVPHLVTASYDPTTGIISVYVDGVRRATRDADGEIVGNLSPLVLGNEQPDGSGGNYNGLVDDVKIYSYALTREEVADEYQAVVPGAQCIYPGFIGVEYDVNDNCIIDLADFAAFAEVWLASGLYSSP